MEPTANHDTNGRFVVGNPGGPGNPHAGQVAKLRAVLLQAATPERMQRVVTKLLELAESGDLKAIELVLNRTLGKPASTATGPSVAVQVNNGRTDEERKARTLQIAERVKAAHFAGPSTE